MSKPPALVEINGLKLFIDEELGKAGILAAFTTRGGGKSRPPYDLLNLALHTSDKETAVLDNRRRLARALGVEPERLIFAEQVHGADVVRIDERLAWAGAGPSSPVSPKADAMVTDIAGVYLVILTADCLPIILADPKNKIVAAVHAGWRGTLERIAANAVTAMVEIGADLAEIEACLGPSIGECCYEVGEDLFARFSKTFSSVASAEAPRLNLAAINRSILLEAGVWPDNIRSIDICTKDNSELFYSWRRDGATGRQAAIAALAAPSDSR